MKVIHTSDWHLGKNLDGTKNSRLEEQEKFLEEFINIVEERDPELIIIAGDIYDNGNPPARAEKLFYSTLKRLSDKGKRAILVIAGNHDNPERLIAASPLAYEHGVIMVGTPKTVVEKGQYGEFQVLDSGEGYVELGIKEEKAVVITLPYPSEKRLNEVFLDDIQDGERKITYSEKIGNIFEQLSEKFREDTVNIAVSHIYINGGETSDSERSIELGGTLAVDPERLPKKAQYIALGHLHRPQRVKGTELHAYYSGSPLQYSKSEINYSKSIYEVELKPGEEAKVERILLSNYKPIEVWRCDGVQEAIEMCEANGQREVWVYLEIKTEEYISQEYIKLMNEYKKDIIEIVPKLSSIEEEFSSSENIKEKKMGDLFKEFYQSQRGVEIKEELLQLFLTIAKDHEEEILEE